MSMRNPRSQKIKKTFPIINGVFGHMNFSFREEVTKQYLDTMFVSMFGMRNLSPVVLTIQNVRNRELTNDELNTIASLLVATYGPKWTKMNAIYDINYDPIHNYLDTFGDSNTIDVDGTRSSSSSGSVTYGKTVTGSSNRTDTLNGSVTTTNDTTRTLTDALTVTETRNLANSSTRTDNLSESVTYGKTDTRTDNLTEEMEYGKIDTRVDNLTQGDNGSKVMTGSHRNQNDVIPFNGSTQLNTDGTTLSYNTETETDSNTRTNTGDVTDTLSGTDTKDNTGTQTVASTGSDTRANSGTQTIGGTDTGTVTNANSGTQTTVDDIDITQTNSATNTRNVLTGETEGGSDSTSNSSSYTDDFTTTKIRSGQHFGNIGNITSQKMIKEEVELWRWNYIMEILNDVKEFCTLPVYLNAFDDSYEDDYPEDDDD